jgi:general nucleoside transport system ATP-binding protein
MGNSNDTHEGSSGGGATRVWVTMRGIRKAYGPTVANDNVDFDLRQGEIHALLGENGAGKTTLMSILFGLVPPDAGVITVEGEAVEFKSPNDALQFGVGMVHQHFMLVPSFSVAESVVLGSESAWTPNLRRREIEADVRRVAERFGIGVDPSSRVKELPIDSQQRVEILKLLYRGAKVLILDEPTSSLGPTQVAGLFATLKELRDEGHAIVIVTHKLSEVVEIADRVTVLRAGTVSTVASRGSFDQRTLAYAMTGREISPLPPREALATSAGAPPLQVDDLVVDGTTGLNTVRGVSFDIDEGEILGVAGVEGNGQRELVDALAGVRKVAAGSVVVNGDDVTGASPRTRHAVGLSVIPEDRQGWGLVLDMTVAENLGLSGIPTGKFSRKGFLDRRSLKIAARQLLTEYDVRPPDPDAQMLSLSGGNQQKVVLARELSRDLKVLIAADPTRGLDVGASEFVHRRLLRVRESGCATLLVSHDLDELLKLSDRIIVLFRGQIAYEAPTREVSIADLALAMAGAAPSSPRPEGMTPPTAVA